MVTYTYKLKPKARRDGYLGDLIDRHNMLWNKFVWLEEVSRKRRGKHINGTALDRYVNLHKKGHGWDYMIAGLDAQSIQATIQRREVAFDKFFKYAKAKSEGKPVDKKESPPKFKRVKGAGSFTMKQTGWKIGEGSISIGRFISKGGPKEIHTYKYWDSRPLEGKPKTMTVRRDALGDLWLHVVTDKTPFSPLPKTGIDAGFDFGSDPFFMDSHGRKWEAPRIYFKYLADLKKIDRRIARCVKGSNNQKRLYKERARLYRDIENMRDDWQRKLAWELCRTYDVLCFENLDLADMGKHHKSKEKDLVPNDKKKLKKWRRKLKDYAPAAFIEKVKWIAQKAGKQVLIVPSKWDPTSQKCHFCKAINPTVKDVNIKKWKCPSCGAVLHRDLNAAINAEVDAKAGAAKQESKGTRGCAGGASSVDVGQSGKTARESRWARIRKPSKPKGGDAGLAEEHLHGTQTHDSGLAGGIPHALAVGGCQCDVPQTKIFRVKAV